MEGIFFIYIFFSDKLSDSVRSRHAIINPTTFPVKADFLI